MYNCNTVKWSTFGIDVGRKELAEKVASEFNAAYRGLFPVSELLLHPGEAMHFCDNVRRQFAYWDLPDNIILRSLSE